MSFAEQEVRSKMTAAACNPRGLPGPSQDAEHSRKRRKISPGSENQLVAYEPLPRTSHYAAAIDEQVFVVSGLTQHLSNRKDALPCLVEIYDPQFGEWSQRSTTWVGEPPLTETFGLYNGACTSIGEDFYTYGGYLASAELSDTLSKLDTKTMKWSHVNRPKNAHSQYCRPMKKRGCSMVGIGDRKLALFGGYALKSSNVTNEFFEFQADGISPYGWTNEIHIFDIKKSMWSVPTLTGDLPPPGSDCSFTSINKQTTFLFGGFQPKSILNQRSNDIYRMDYNDKDNSMLWKKIEKGSDLEVMDCNEGDNSESKMEVTQMVNRSDSNEIPWPKGRAGHAACCLGYGEENPQLLITNGLTMGDKELNLLADAWLFDVTSEKWEKLKLRPADDAQPRLWHSTTAVIIEKGRVIKAIVFGGCPNLPCTRGTDHEDPTDIEKLSKTVVMTFKSIEVRSANGNDVVTKKWELDSIEDIQQDDLALDGEKLKVFKMLR